MSRDQTVVQLEFLETRHTRFEPDKYAVCPDRPLVWLQRVCCWIMGRLGAYSRVDWATFETVPINRKDFIEQLLVQKASLFETFNMDGAVLLIGPADWAELLHSAHLRGHMQHWIEFEVPFSSGRRKACGLTVRVIPWMKGMLVMP